MITTSVNIYDTSAYYFDLPKELIAQNPAEPRDHARLLYNNKATGEVQHLHFYDLPRLLKEGDLLVMNDTRVLPARLMGVKESSGRAVEIFCLSADELNPQKWRALLKPGKKLPENSVVLLKNGTSVLVGGYLGDGVREIYFPKEISPIAQLLEIGEIPLPPYITENTSPSERYQTVYSEREKLQSSAAPTAGLHFTEELLSRLKQQGISTSYVTLNVGLGTFRPVKSRDIREHEMHGEVCEMPQKTANSIMATRQRGGRVIAVGTTSIRTIESFTSENGFVTSGTKNTHIFIYPGYHFKGVDGVITNFHLPESTLMMLICSFLGYENTMKSYNVAINEKYKFFSFGDSMLVL